MMEGHPYKTLPPVLIAANVHIMAKMANKLPNKVTPFDLQIFNNLFLIYISDELGSRGDFLLPWFLLFFIFVGEVGEVGKGRQYLAFTFQHHFFLFFPTSHSLCSSNIYLKFEVAFCRKFPVCMMVKKVPSLIISYCWTFSTVLFFSFNFITTSIIYLFLVAMLIHCSLPSVI